MSKLSSKDDEYVFSWKLFTGWDFMIGKINLKTSLNVNRMNIFSSLQVMPRQRTIELPPLCSVSRRHFWKKPKRKKTNKSSHKNSEIHVCTQMHFLFVLLFLQLESHCAQNYC